MTPRHPATARRLVLAVVVVGLAWAGAVAAARPPGKAAAAAYARAVNLRAADLPGFTGSTRHTTAAEKHFAIQVTRCAGGTLPGQGVVDVDSLDFTRRSVIGLAEQEASSTSSASSACS